MKNVRQQLVTNLRSLFATHLALGGRARGRRNSWSGICSGELQTLESRQLLTVTGLQAVHRAGQTFLTWQEDTTVVGEQYHVYRSTSPITTQNLNNAQHLTSKWGALDDDTSVHKLTGPNAPANFVIQDLTTPLSDNTGLFVYTTPTGQSGSYYYAVTQVTNGNEQRTVSAGSSLQTAVVETVATPQPVLVYSANGGKSRVYTQFMDYANWNPTFNGYAYNYSVALPFNYSPSTPFALKVMPHAYGDRYRVVPEAEYEWPLVELFVDDPGGDVGSVSTWWYGFAADHNYKTDGQIPTSGRIENFTEQRVLKAIDEVVSTFNINTNEIHVEGHSMGASGALSLGMRYGNVIAATFSSEPMTNYASSPLFQEDFQRLWGTQAANLPIVNRGIHAGQLLKHNNTGVYDWMNHHQQIVARRGEDMAFLMFGHGKADDIIDWQTQGRQFIQYVNQARVAFTAEQRFGWDHNFMSFNFVNRPMFSTSDGGLGEWILDGSYSFLSFTNATGSGPNVPSLNGTDFYNIDLNWSVPWNNFHVGIVDQSDHYEVSIRSDNGTQTADVTPRNLQNYVTLPGMSVQWKNVRNSTGQIIQSGTVTADAKGLVTIPAFQISTGSGNRLILDTIMTPPVITTQPGPTTDRTPAINWSTVASATGYQIWIDNVSTGQKPIINRLVTNPQFVPDVELPIGLYRVWVRATKTGGGYTGWSTPVDLQIRIPTTFPTLQTWNNNSRPQIAWDPVPGAVRYDMWITNNTTGQAPFLRRSDLTSTNYVPIVDMPLGQYTVWVQAIDASGRSGGWSFGNIFRIATKTVTFGPEGSTVLTTPTFTWASVPGAATYGIYMTNLRTGAVEFNLQGITGTNWTASSPLPAGDRRWWVRAFASDGQASFWSDPKVVGIQSAPTLFTPFGTISQTRPTFAWSGVGGAARYELYVARTDGGGVVIDLKNINGTTYTPGTPLSAGPYRVWVRAVSAANVYSSWSTAVDFTVTQITPDQPSPAFVVSPLQSQVFSDDLRLQLTVVSEFTNGAVNAKRPEANQSGDAESQAKASLAEAVADQSVRTNADFSSNAAAGLLEPKTAGSDPDSQRLDPLLIDLLMGTSSLDQVLLSCHRTTT